MKNIGTSIPLVRPADFARRQLSGVRVANRAPTVARRFTVAPLLKDPYRLGILALLFQTIVKFTGFFPAIEPLRFPLILFFFCVLCAVLRPKQSIASDTLRYRVPQLVLYQSAVVCASTVFGISQGNSAEFIIDKYSKTIVFAFLLMLSLRGVTDVRRMVKTTAFAGIGLAFAAVFVVHVSKDVGSNGYDANDIGCIVVMTLPLVLLVLQSEKGLWRILSMVGIPLIGVTVTMSASRGAFLGVVAVGLALLFFLPGVSVVKRVSSLAGIVVTLMLFAPASYWVSMHNIVADPKADYNWDSGQGRRMLAERGIGYMLQYPVFGVGVNNFGRAEITISDFFKAELARGAKRLPRPSAPHNSWVQAGAETGITGLLIWVALVIGSAGGVIRLRRRMPSAWAKDGTPDQRFLYLATLYVPIAVLGFVVTATFLSFAWSDQSYVLPAIALGIQKAFEEQMSLAGGGPIRPHLGQATGRVARLPATGRRLGHAAVNGIR